jgi:choline monooxygenase
MTRSINELLSNEQIDSIRKPIGQALTFPASAYFDLEFYRLEIEKIYKKQWVAVLFDFDIPDPGHARPFEFCDMPLVAVRGRDRVVRVFHNICPYDGCLTVIDPVSGLDEIVTPYHGWAYDLCGKLVRAPYWDGTREGTLQALEGKQVDLAPVHSRVFLNTIFINLSASPASFENFIAPIFRSLQEYDLDDGRVGLGRDGAPYSGEARVKTNWKTFFENACVNVLHESFVHALYSASPEVPRIKEDGLPSYSNILDGNLMALSYNRVDFQETYPHVDAPHMGKDPDHEPRVETFGTLYPNLYISASSQFIEVGYVLPLGPEECVSRVSYRFHKEVATSPDALAGRNVVVNMFYDAFMEDARIAEAVQRGRKSPVYKQKFYAPFWDGMHHYLNKLILSDLSDRDPRG